MPLNTCPKQVTRGITLREGIASRVQEMNGSILEITFAFRRVMPYTISDARRVLKKISIALKGGIWVGIEKKIRNSPNPSRIAHL